MYTISKRKIKIIIQRLKMQLYMYRILRGARRIFNRLRGYVYVLFVVIILAFIVAVIGIIIGVYSGIGQGMWNMSEFVLSSAITVIMLNIIKDEKDRHERLKKQFDGVYCGYFIIESVFGSSSKISLYRSAERKYVFKYILDFEDDEINEDFGDDYLYYEEVDELQEYLEDIKKSTTNDFELNDYEVDCIKKCARKIIPYIKKIRQLSNADGRALWLEIYDDITHLYYILSYPWALPNDLIINARIRALENGWIFPNSIPLVFDVEEKTYYFIRINMYEIIVKAYSNGEECYLTKYDVSILFYKYFDCLVFFDELSCTCIMDGE